ncbi:MAG TPA: hypothetical protein VFF79_03415, partial [Conexibacter sp.]|nr:hypothetical protein [Conexibacter sp.]
IDTNWKTLTAGGSHECGIRTNGTLGCIGSNSKGQLGDGTTTDSAMPVPVQGIDSATQIAAALDTTCALLAGGNVACWGWGGSGQLGNGTTNDSAVPVMVSGITDAVAIAAGEDDVCAVLRDGSVECWGSNGYLELATTSIQYISAVPVPIVGVSNATAVTIGTLHACALLAGGDVSCWGGGYAGQLGNGTNPVVSMPVSVSGIANATSIAAGEGFSPPSDHTCALLATGAIECWGYNGYGQLGDGTTADRSTPVAVSGLE